MANRRNDEPGMTVAQGLATLALGRRFSLAEGGDVRETPSGSDRLLLREIQAGGSGL